MNCCNVLGIKPEWKPFFDGGLHLLAETEDEKYRLHELIHELKNGSNNQDAINFIMYHIKMTTPVFGEWNYTKYLQDQKSDHPL